MAATPKFTGLDGVARETQVLSTDRATRFFTGIVDANTVDVQVSIRGSAFSANPDLVTFEGTSFTVPNPSAFPEGLPLFPGDNLIQVKSILTNGAATAPGQVTARLSLDRDVQADALAPSGVWVERFDRTVKIMVEGLDDDRVQGYNFYASAAPGGGSTGYYKINPTLVIAGTTSEEVSPLGSLSVDAAVATNLDGSPAADPLLFSVRGDQTDRLGNVVQADFHESVAVSELVSHLRFDATLSSVRQVQQFSFVHDRLSNLNSAVNPAIPNSEFNVIPDTDPLYYVVTAVYAIQDQDTTTEYESEFSPEVAAAPLVVTPNVGNFPAVSRQQIVRDTILSIQRSQPTIDVKPGSTTRDVVIDPFSSEAERLRFIIDFVHRAQAFTTLLEIDDPGFTGFSIPVNQSAYKIALKQAFFLQSDADVQAVVDNAFDKLASRYGVTRDPGKRARGVITAYLTQRPSGTRNIPIGSSVTGAPVGFRTTSAGQIGVSGAGISYSPSTGRWSTQLFVQADQPGTAGNVGPQTLRGFANISGIQVVNEDWTFGGLNAETNRQLAERADAQLSSVDSGSYRGYTRAAISVPGVQQVNVVDAGHPLMLRDIYPATGQHIGGKVDVWLRGENVAKVTDSFAFKFEIARNVQFEPTGDFADLKFRAVDSKLGSANPIIEMLDNPAYGFEFVNATTGQVFDLTDVTILPPDGIQLSADHNDPVGAVSFGDVFFGSYRYRTSDRFVFPRQPVRSITSLTGDPSRTGLVNPALYRLFHPASPLEKGRSSDAGDYLQVILPADTSLPTIPSGEPLEVVDESHVLLGGTEYLDNLGINPVTVVVQSPDKTVTYVSPYDPSVALGATPDYTFVQEKGSAPLGLSIPAGSQLENGDEVLVSYRHDENFTVEYTTNILVGIAQEKINSTRHATADALAKEGSSLGADIYATVVLRKRQKPSQADQSLRSALARLIGSLGQGVPLHQSDVIRAIEEIPAVSYVVVPLTKLTVSDGSLIFPETLNSAAGAYLRIESWSQGPTVDVFLLTDPLDWSTTDAGGPENEFRGVLRDDLRLTHHESAPNFNGVPLKDVVNSAFIIGNSGLLIPGYSDDATLQVQYPLASSSDLLARRVELTANRVLLALPKGATPDQSSYKAMYIVSGDNGVKSIEPGPVSWVTLGDLDFTYDEDKTINERLKGV